MPITTEKTCPACGKQFQHQVRYESKRAYCSKSCRLRVWNKERRKKFPEKVRAEERAAYERNREKKMAGMREHYRKNRERYIEKNRQWFAANRDDRNARRNQYYYEHQEHSMQKSRENGYKMRVNQPWKHLLHAADGRARKKSVPFTLTLDWAEKRWTGHCELTGIEFFLGQRGSGPKIFSASIDRIRPELGYVPENCRFILWAINAFKGESGDEDMFRIAEALLAFRKSPLESKG